MFFRPLRCPHCPDFCLTTTTRRTTLTSVGACVRFMAGQRAQQSVRRCVHMAERLVFLSYSGHDAFEASLLQYAVETTLAAEFLRVWTYQRDQERSERDVASALKARLRDSLAMLFLVSPSTLDGGAAQWMELAYADAFNVRTFILLHHLSFQELKAREAGVPPLLLASQCNQAMQWKEVVGDLRVLAKEASQP